MICVRAARAGCTTVYSELVEGFRGFRNVGERAVSLPLNPHKLVIPTKLWIGSQPIHGAWRDLLFLFAGYGDCVNCH